MSKALHSKNKHRNGYSFHDLVKAYPPLRAYVRDNGHGQPGIDFSDAAAVKVFNAALLKKDYGISHWDIPQGALCPPIPGRVDYIHYVADLPGLVKKASAVTLLDIGAGASLIYPLLAASAYGWNCTASDISEESLANCSTILEGNPELQKNITLRLQSDRHAMFSGIIRSGEYYDVTVCNPPFHASPEEARSGSIRKEANLARSRGEKVNAADATLNFGGMENELWCNGGEALFLKKMINESKQFASQVGWFTSLVSKAENLKSLKKLLNKSGATDVREIEMTQGKKITRILAWTFRK
ncbi:MAG: 23S rRNA (adenine(1618)-N(6))-methyltransferase RlmF [Thalassolituus sp.]